jgi:hypothetical protein
MVRLQWSSAAVLLSSGSLLLGVVESGLPSPKIARWRLRALKILMALIW